jgi:hypothetical protein
VCPPSNFVVVLSTPSLPSSFKSCYSHHRPPGVATVVGTSPPIPDSAAPLSIGCLGELPPPPPCQVCSLLPPCARADRPSTPSPPGRFTRHRDRPAHGDQRRSVHHVVRPGRFSRWAKLVPPGLGTKSDPALCGRLNSFSN